MIGLYTFYGLALYLIQILECASPILLLPEEFSDTTSSFEISSIWILSLNLYGIVYKMVKGDMKKMLQIV